MAVIKSEKVMFQGCCETGLLIPVFSLEKFRNTELAWSLAYPRWLLELRLFYTHSLASWLYFLLRSWKMSWFGILKPKNVLGKSDQCSTNGRRRKNIF